MSVRINIKSKLFSAAGALLMIVYATQAQSTQELLPANIDVISIDTTLVTVNVSVTDHKNKRLPGLKLEDFRVSDEGKLVSPEFFDTGGPLSIVFVVDVSSSMRAHWHDLKSGLKKFLAKEPEGSDYTLITFNEKAQLVTSSANAKQLWETFNTLRPYGETALFDGLLLGLQALERAPQRHKALVLLSDGEDNSSEAGLSAVEHHALLHRATIYSVGILFDRELSPYQVGGKKLLNQLAAATGGLVLFPETNRIPAVLNLIRVDLSDQYSLSYYPPKKTLGWHRVEINIAQNVSRLNLRYQQRYQMK
ncbi:MAG TPA: VWA domain-containing protein [Blastocatellia bacterium]|nr:VWA domain-containing protein [Blastocatellia bacterium]